MSINAFNLENPRSRNIEAKIKKLFVRGELVNYKVADKAAGRGFVVGADGVMTWRDIIAAPGVYGNQINVNFLSNQIEQGANYTLKYNRALTSFNPLIYSLETVNNVKELKLLTANDTKFGVFVNITTKGGNSPIKFELRRNNVTIPRTQFYSRSRLDNLDVLTNYSTSNFYGTINIQQNDIITVEVVSNASRPLELDSTESYITLFYLPA